MYHIFTTFVRNIIYLLYLYVKVNTKLIKKFKIKLIEKFNIDLVAKMVNVSILAILFLTIFYSTFHFFDFSF